MKLAKARKIGTHFNSFDYSSQLENPMNTKAFGKLEKDAT